MFTDGLSNLLKMFGFQMKPPQRHEKVLKSFDLPGFAEHIKSSKKIIFMNGAGELKEIIRLLMIN